MHSTRELRRCTATSKCLRESHGNVRNTSRSFVAEMIALRWRVMADSGTLRMSCSFDFSDALAANSLPSILTTPHKHGKFSRAVATTAALAMAAPELAEEAIKR